MYIYIYIILNIYIWYIYIYIYIFIVCMYIFTHFRSTSLARQVKAREELQPLGEVGDEIVEGLYSTAEARGPVADIDIDITGI